MIAIPIGIIIFLFFVLTILYQDEYRKRKLTRKSARLNRFWNTGRERRKSTRINTEIDVLYEVISAGASAKLTSRTINISAGGINLALNEKLFPGAILDLELNIAQTSRHIFTQGEIVWVKQISEKFSNQKKERFFATGIKFIQMKPEDETFLRSFINQKIKNGTAQITP